MVGVPQVLQSGAQLGHQGRQSVKALLSHQRHLFLRHLWHLPDHDAPLRVSAQQHPALLLALPVEEGQRWKAGRALHNKK